MHWVDGCESELLPHTRSRSIRDRRASVTSFLPFLTSSAALIIYAGQLALHIYTPLRPTNPTGRISNPDATTNTHRHTASPWQTHQWSQMVPQTCADFNKRNDESDRSHHELLSRLLRSSECCLWACGCESHLLKTFHIFFSITVAGTDLLVCSASRQHPKAITRNT